MWPVRIQRLLNAALMLALLTGASGTLRTYSSGMMTRLGFAVATDIDADILIVDEVLSVGDKDFQVKSQARMRSLMGRGATVLIASHDLEAVRNICQRAAWLENGGVKAMGKAADVVLQYVQAPASFQLRDPVKTPVKME